MRAAPYGDALAVIDLEGDGQLEMFVGASDGSTKLLSLTRRADYSWQLPLPDGSMLLIRQEVASLGTNCPCPHCPAPSQKVWHYNIEYQGTTKAGSENRSLFNIHAAGQVLGMAWNVIVAIAAFLMGIFLMPFRQPGYA